jgi:hypothetical protein
MAQRKIKIALASSISNPSAEASIWFDNQVIQNNITISNSIENPLIIEHTFEAGSLHSLKIKMNNDYYENINNDLNLIISYVMLSDEEENYAPYTYLVNSSDENCRAVDNLKLITNTLWAVTDIFELNFDVNNPTTWYDYYQYDVDNPQADGSTIV